MNLKTHSISLFKLCLVIQPWLNDKFWQIQICFFPGSWQPLKELLTEHWINRQKIKTERHWVTTFLQTLLNYSEVRRQQDDDRHQRRCPLGPDRPTRSDRRVRVRLRRRKLVVQTLRTFQNQSARRWELI